MKHIASRIHALLARELPIGLVIRRGPSKAVATVLWHRDRDEFRLGQWLKGRIYERRSDLSPDGKYFLYFAMNGKWQSEARGAWTAISQTPYLKALAIFAKGDCWHGGGLWTGKTTYWLNDGYGHSVLRDTTAVRRDKRYRPSENYGGECPGVYYLRLLRDGWKFAEHVPLGKWRDKDVFERKTEKGWILRKIAHAEVGAPPGKGCYWDEHELARPESGTVLAYPDWEWADVDGKRLVWAAGGKLYSGRLSDEGLVNETELFDFNHMTFEPIEAPY
jgi:hypothetical protein